jgi:hypothetical protein
LFEENLIMENNHAQMPQEALNHQFLAAIESGDLILVRDLLRSGANVSAVDAQGRTALDIACAGGHERIIEEIARPKPMLWVERNDGILPPENINIVVMLTSGLTEIGRNIGGMYCWLDQANDRFIADAETPEDTWRCVAAFVVIEPYAMHGWKYKESDPGASRQRIGLA